MNTLIAFFHLLALVCWIGSIVFFSFFAAPAVFKALERQQAGDVIGVMFPRYYGIGYVCSAIAAATLISTPGGMTDLRLPFLVVMTACTFYAGCVINPQARALKHRMRENPNDLETLEARFRSLHGWSVRLNASVLVFGLGLLWITAMGLRM